MDDHQELPEEVLGQLHEDEGLARLPAWAHLENHWQLEHIHGVSVGLWPTDILQLEGCVKGVAMACAFRMLGMTRWSVLHWESGRCPRGGREEHRHGEDGICNLGIELGANHHSHLARQLQE